jgi:hypothetical protein
VFADETGTSVMGIMLDTIAQKYLLNELRVSRTDQFGNIKQEVK